MALFSKKSKKIICCGDSYTDNYRHGNEGKVPYNVWPNFFGEKFSTNEYFIPSKDLMNLGSSAAGNYEIYSRTVDAITSQKNIGLIIVMWSEFSRIDLEVDMRYFKADKKANSATDKFGYLSYVRLHKGKTHFPVYFENLNPIKILRDQRRGNDFLVFGHTIPQKTFSQCLETPRWKYELSKIYQNKKTSNVYSGINAFLRYVYSIQSICENENIPLMQIMGPTPCQAMFNWNGVRPGATRQEACKMLLQHPSLNKIKDNFIGWPLFKEIGGFHVDDLLEKNDSKWKGRRGSQWPSNLRISENDNHPNLKGHKIIGEYLYEQYKNLYSNS